MANEFEVDRELRPLARLVSKDKGKPNLMGVKVEPGKDGDRFTVTDGHRMLSVVAKPGHGEAVGIDCVVGVEEWKAGLAHVATDKEGRAAHPTVSMEVDAGNVVIHNLGGETRAVTVEGELVSGTFPKVDECVPEYVVQLDSTGLNEKGADVYAVQVDPALLAGLLKTMGDLREGPVLLHVPRNPHSPVKVTGPFGTGEMVGVVMPIAPRGD